MFSSVCHGRLSILSFFHEFFMNLRGNVRVSAPVLSAIDSPEDVMDIPSRFPRNQFTADGTTAILIQPEPDELFPAPQRVLHLEADTFLKIHPPLRVEGIGFQLDQSVSPDGRIRRFPQ
jgi:hypothetical protein